MFMILILIDDLISKLQGLGFGSFSVKQELKSFRKYIKNGKIFIDVGGNIGNYTKCIFTLYNPEEVHIFEPSQFNNLILKRNFINNKIVFINDFALSNINGNSILYSDKEGSGLASLSKRRLNHFNLDMSNEESISLKKFEDYWDNNIKSNVIDLFKIDVEGHELKVLEGIGEKIYNIKIIQFEFGGCNIDTKTFFQDFWYFFSNKNFDIYRITPFGNFKITKYSESLERFTTTNYFCVNKNFYP